MDIEHDRELSDFLVYAKEQLPYASEHSRQRFIYQMCIECDKLTPEQIERAMIQKLYGRCKFALREKPIEYIKNLYKIKQIWFKLAYIR
jgi:hypothetical protein